PKSSAPKRPHSSQIKASSGRGVSATTPSYLMSRQMPHHRAAVDQRDDEQADARSFFDLQQCTLIELAVAARDRPAQAREPQTRPECHAGDARALAFPRRL